MDDRRSVVIDVAAERLGKRRRTIYNWINAGRLDAVRVGSSQRVLVSSIEQLAPSSEHEATASAQQPT